MSTTTTTTNTILSVKTRENNLGASLEEFCLVLELLFYSFCIIITNRKRAFTITNRIIHAGEKIPILFI